jgi:hypothetical protein
LKDRRQFERFSLTLPARMETITSGKKQVFELKTRDISSSGAFINTAEQFSEGERFKLNLVASSEKIKKLTGAKSLIECEGNIIRSTPAGVAISFDKDCQVLSLKGF